jgi:WD40 repeat protein
MMKYFLLLLFFCGISLTYGQDLSCLDQFQALAPIQPEINPTNRLGGYAQTMAWYSSRCLLIGSHAGLWLYDVDEPDRPLMIATSGDRAIVSVAVNPSNSTIAFNVAEENLVYLVSLDGASSTIQADGDAVTSISFSADGSLIAIGSSIIDGPMNAYYDALIQIWRVADQTEIGYLVTDVGWVTEITITLDNQYLFLTGSRDGHFEGYVEFWDIAAETRIWDYYYLQRNIELTISDPFRVFMGAISGQNVAFGGLYSYNDYDDYDGSAIHIWNVDSQERRLEIIVALSDYGSSERPLRVITFNFEGTVIVSTSTDGIVSLWNVKDGSTIAQFNTSLTDVLTLSYSPDDRFLAVLSLTDTAIWDVESQTEYVLLESLALSTSGD